MLTKMLSDLASIIIEKCSGVLNTSTENLGSPYDVLDVFGSAIGKVVSRVHLGVCSYSHACSPMKKLD
jgi:hypothetical protein